MQEYEQLIRLIEATNLPEAFAILDKFEPHFEKKTTYHELKGDFITPPQGFSVPKFCERLLVFVESEKHLFASYLQITENSTKLALPKILDTNTLDFEHCFRKTFSQKLVQEIFMRHHSLNLMGGAGQGKTRQLNDLRKIATKEQMGVALVNVLAFRADYEAFMRDIAMQLELQKMNFEYFSDLLYEIDRVRKNRQMLIMIDSLEILNEQANNDSRYDHRFISGLNNLKHKDNIHLVVASRERLDTILFTGNTSLIDFRSIDVPHPLPTEILAEIGRQGSSITKHPHKVLIRNLVLDQPDAYRLLDFLNRKAFTHYQENKFNQKLLNEWYAEYRKQHP